jgi:hypothetical protein
MRKNQLIYANFVSIIVNDTLNTDRIFFFTEINEIIGLGDISKHKNSVESDQWHDNIRFIF